MKISTILSPKSHSQKLADLKSMDINELLEVKENVNWMNELHIHDIVIGTWGNQRKR